jgi:hypothetical protein
MSDPHGSPGGRLVDVPQVPCIPRGRDAGISGLNEHRVTTVRTGPTVNLGGVE